MDRSGWFYLSTGLWAVFMLAIFIQAIRLCYRIEARSENLRNRTGLPQRAQILHVAANWKVARDPETQRLRHRMLGLLGTDLAGFALFWAGLLVADLS